MNYVRCTLADPTIFIARILYNTVVEKNKTKAKNAAMLSLGTNRRKKNHLEFEKAVPTNINRNVFFSFEMGLNPCKVGRCDRRQLSGQWTSLGCQIKLFGRRNCVTSAPLTRVRVLKSDLSFDQGSVI